MIDIPASLKDAVKEQRAVLFLGAGASRNAKHPEGDQIPQGDSLRKLICQKFLGGELMQKPLNAVAAMAANEAGLAEFQSYISNLFMPFEPADFHFLIPKFRWRAIVTTNFDLIVERAYANSTNSRQNLIKTVKDGDRFDTRLNKESNPVGFYKLHGCIESHSDLEIPLILSNEQYASYRKNRTRLYDRFRDLGYEYPIIFSGYSISDQHIQELLFDLTDPSIGRPPFYYISPKITDLEKRYWEKLRVFSVEASFEDFLKTIDQAIPSLARVLPIEIGGGELSIRKHYRIAQPTESLSLKSYLTTDTTHIHSALTAPRQDPRQFYRGYDDGWGCILQNLDVYRSFSDSVLVDTILLDEENRSTTELFLLKGPGGNGKSVSLKRIAWEAGVTYDYLVLYNEIPAGLRIEPLAEIYRLTGKRTFLFVDRVALVRDELRKLLENSRSQSIPLSIVGAERDNEWNIYCEQLEPFLRQEFPVRYLSEREIRKLLSLLEQHNALGLLQNLAPEDRVRKFVEGAERQLLVALHEATLGIPFEEIVVDEFRRIEPAVARNLYLDICALHQFDAPVRAGLISRASGVRFEQFQAEFIQPLENVVRVVEDRHNRDVYYRSRHQHIAEIVFNKMLSSPEDKFDLLVRLIKSMNIDYSSDSETFYRSIKGRRIADMFPNSELGRLFYERVQETMSNDPVSWHQRAVFEMQHPSGSLAQAEEAAAHAFELNPNNHSIQHTQAEIARQMANKTDDPLRKQSLRLITRRKLSKNNDRTNEYDLYTRAQLAIDEFKEFAISLNVSDDKGPPTTFLGAAKETETVIQRGLQIFPESSQLLAAEATFREFLDQTAQARQALERAFNLNPRQDWLAVRLARMYQASKEIMNSKRVLKACLQDNPSSKLAHLEMGRVLIVAGENDGAIDHLRRSFTVGDNNFEGQFWYARELFLQGQGDKAGELFVALNSKAPGRFRTKAAAVAERDGITIRYNCRVERKEEGYAFLKLYAFPKNIFASRADSDPREWDKLYARAEAKCSLAFNRRGARAISITLAS
ncbi:MAG: SIR2 family protein [Candidatus Dadabacteria bacterium]|nr:SIR2 family protein [Candidatus Dadabacteria bacterium]MDE0403984.1 SIR2 family protein [Nitrospira sp.]MDE0504398.1 SIR2 family protein [Candidatus Poribacteria bacterium]